MRSGFVVLTEQDKLLWDIKYSYADNIVGRKVTGYHANKCVMTKACLVALKQVQHNIAKYGLNLLIWDAYRPYKAVLDFWHWSQDVDDNHTQASYYPHLKKEDLFSKGYFNKTSNHCSGSTVDLTLIDQFGHVLDMGTFFDFMDPSSHPDSAEVSSEARANRNLLQSEMLRVGFEPIHTEWWYFRLIDEPFVNQAFDFDITGLPTKVLA